MIDDNDEQSLLLLFRGQAKYPNGEMLSFEKGTTNDFGALSRLFPGAFEIVVWSVDGKTLPKPHIISPP